jgi:capsular polysaccharide transport system permease protein
MLVAKARGGSVSHDIKVASLMVRSGLEVQQATVKALFLREIKTRFGKYRLGYFWAVLEPAAHLLVLMVILVS